MKIKRKHGPKAWQPDTTARVCYRPSAALLPPQGMP
jgi:hypothetical protein